MKRFPMLIKPTIKPIALSLCILILSACQTWEGLRADIASIEMSDFQTASSVDPQKTQAADFLIDGDCPTIQIVDELSMLHEFETPNTPSEQSRISSVTLEDSQSTCTYAERSVTVDLKLAFNGTLGEKGKTTGSNTTSYPFFVAVTSAGGQILAKELFTAPITYNAGQTAQTYTETLRQIIPADSRTQGSRLKVVIGFQLTQNQLAYNRTLIEKREMARQAFETQQLNLARTIKKSADTTTNTTTNIVTQTGDIAKTSLDKSTDIAAEATTTIIKAPSNVINRAGPIDITVP